ncbi:hypothetical protein HDV00_000674 [Rhizophlyctis rosea]|nr:hypothetical protein HDV00_000674 [Rhizophlyctis rosea]
MANATIDAITAALQHPLSSPPIRTILNRLQDPTVITSLTAVSLSYFIYTNFFKNPKTNAKEFTKGSTPILGVIPLFAKNSEKIYNVFDAVSEECGPVGFMRVLNTQIYMISDGALAKEMLTSVFDRLAFSLNLIHCECLGVHALVYGTFKMEMNFTLCPAMRRVSAPPNSEFFSSYRFERASSLKKGLGRLIQNPDVIIMADDDIWRKHRKVLTSSMSTSHLLKSIPQINSTLDDLVLMWERGNVGKDIVVDVQKDMSGVALEALCRALLNVKFDVFNITGDAKYGNASHHVEAFARGIEKRVGKLEIQKAFMKDDFSPSVKALKDLMKELIDEKRAAVAKRGSAKANDSEVDVIETLVTYPDGLNDKDLIDELLIFFIAGHETSANTMATTLKLLAENPPYQQRVYDELVEHLGIDPTTRRAKYPTTNEEISRLKFLDACIKEALRLHPVAGQVARRTRVPVTLGSGANTYTIPEGFDVMVNIRHIHRSPKHWSDPLEFKPERWLDPETSKNPHYLPFAHGPQLCLGMRWANIEMRLTVARVVGRYGLEMVPGQVFEEKMVMTIGFKDGIKVKLTPRV